MKHLTFRLLTLVIQLWVCMGCVLASHDRYATGARSSGMAGMGVMLPGFWAVQYNPAGLAGLDRLHLGFHHESPYLMPRVGSGSLAIALPARPGTLAACYSSFGYSLYRESRLSLAFGRSFGERLSAGVQINYFHSHIAEGYGDKGIPGVEAGLIFRPVENLLAGVHVFNPAPWPEKSETFEGLPTIFRTGIAWFFHKGFLAGVEMEKDLEHLPAWKAGMEYQVMEKLWLRAGTAFNPGIWSFGIGYQTSGLKADLAFSNHQVLGITPHLSILVSIE